jgi:hypothetical protein
VTLLSLLVGCQLFAPPPPPPPEEPACTLALDALEGRTFVREQRNKQNNGDEPDLWARMKLGAGNRITYNSRSPFDMYEYGCKKEKGALQCVQDVSNDPAKLKQYCQTLWANKGTCSVAELAGMTGAPVAAATAAQKEITEAIAKMKPDEKDRMKIAFSNPNNQLRGLLKVKVNSEDCKLSVVDTYQTMEGGELREHETYVGNSRFIESSQTLPFTKCDGLGLVAVVAGSNPPQPKAEWGVGEVVPFVTRNPGLEKADAACTYSMDLWSDFTPVATGQAVTADADGKLEWTHSGTFADAGKHVVQMVRYKACGGEPQRVDDLCTMIQVQ